MQREETADRQPVIILEPRFMHAHGEVKLALTEIKSTDREQRCHGAFLSIYISYFTGALFRKTRQMVGLQSFKVFTFMMTTLFSLLMDSSLAS